MECRLSSSSGAWQCQVSIRWEFGKDGSAKDEVHEVPFGGLITSKADVELALRRAQTAVLNPHIPSSKYSALSLEDLRKEPPNKLLFSRNVVCVDLTGPELTDLAFIDLPGESESYRLFSISTDGVFCRDYSERRYRHCTFS